MTFQTILHRYLPYLDACRDCIVADLNKTPGTAVLAEYFQGGKMFRALLTFVAASAIGIELGIMVPVASALELMHGASLIHDDIVDETDERRGRPALHVQMGVGPALILGDYLILRSFTVFRESHHVFGLEKVMEASHTLNAYAQSCCLGELRELTPTVEGDPEEEYLAIAQGKTASQFAVAVELPAILGGRPSEEIDALRTYGHSVGIAYQIQDDLLDIEADTGPLEPLAGSSPGKTKLILPLIYLERYGSPTVIQQYRQILQSGGGRGGRLVTFLKTEGIIDRIQGTQARYLTSAFQALDSFPPSSELATLSALAAYTVNRHA